MEQLSEQESTITAIVIMGATGTGKSTFINLLTNDENIRIGHNQESETFGVQTAHYIDQMTGRTVILIDTPGFDDSREGVTDTDILEKIVRFLEPEKGERIKVNGIIYMHRISDPRVSGTSRKNIKMFHSLCGEAGLGNVRIVTTNWSRVSEDEGNHREADLKQSAFKVLIDAGAQMRRHANTLESARQIMSELIPLKAVTMKIQEELRAGKKLADTAAGRVLAAEMIEIQKKQEREVAYLIKEMNDAEENNNRALRAELEQERKVLEEKMARANADRKRLEATLDVMRVDSTGEQGKSEKIGQLHDRSKEVSVVFKALQARCADLMDPEHQSAEQLCKQNESKLRTTTHPGREPDMTARDDTARMQLLMGELVSERKVQLQQIEQSIMRKRDSREATIHLEQLESHLRRLEATIQAAEKKKGERGWAALKKKAVEGFHYVLDELSKW